ncbi:MAG TPA: DinB family protein [Blastocatellia bacterium]|nr:DinB family protein [Blastocatellia bacterium]
MSHAIIGRPEPTEHAEYYSRYINLVPEDDLCAAMREQTEATLAFLRSLPEAVGDLRYAPGKWSVKELIGHVIDSERVFAMRAAYFARLDPAALPSFEQDDWVRAASFDEQPLAELIEEFEYVRRGNLYFFRHLTPEAWLRRGTASGYEFTVRALAYIIVGHERYHLEILRSRYL